MEFFRIQQNDSCTPVPFIIELDEIIPPRMARKVNYWNYPQNFGAYVDSNENNVYSDIISKQIFLISPKMKFVFDLYARDILYQYICLLDNPNKRFEFYYHAFFEEVDCLHPSSTYNKNRSVFEKIVLNEALVQNRHIFRVENVNTNMVIISLQAVESLLRRDAKGLKLTPVTLRRDSNA